MEQCPRYFAQRWTSSGSLARAQLTAADDLPEVT
jgi:hypothetical protein